MDEASQRFFDEQRARFFPPAINFLPAHVTIFHHLPGDQATAIAADLQEFAGPHSSFPVDITGLRNLGRGVAYRLESARLVALREHLRDRWLEWLTPQDRQKFSPHITVQNKVDPSEARTTLALLGASFTASHLTAEGLHLWRYDGGPWTHRQTFRFNGA